MIENIEQIALQVAEKVFGEDFKFMLNEPIIEFAKILLSEMVNQQEAVAWMDSERNSRIITAPRRPEEGDDGWIALYTKPIYLLSI